MLHTKDINIFLKGAFIKDPLAILLYNILILNVSYVILIYIAIKTVYIYLFTHIHTHTHNICNIYIITI